MRLGYRLLLGGMLGALGACSSNAPHSSLIPGAPGPGGSGGAGGGGSFPDPDGVGQAGSFILDNGDTDCQRQTCAELGFACGYLLDHCGGVVNCADEGLSCAENQVCSGGIGAPTECVAGGNADCSVCSAIPDCSAAAQPTRLTGRVVSPGRTDGDTPNQVGVPNAIVYILRGSSADVLPPISSGIPTGGTSCDRCEDQDLGPVLVGAVTDANGNYTLEGNVPVDQDFILVVKAGKFRRAITHRLPAGTACTTSALPAALPSNPTRLPRSMSDGLAVNLPRVAVSTGEIDAMECVLAKMGISPTEFANPGAPDAAPRINLFVGGDNTGSPPGRGARIDNSTPHDSVLYTDLARLQRYDMVIADCEAGSWDSDFSERNAGGANVREYVNRGGRLFASHLSFSWLHQNGSADYSEAQPFDTGLGAAATWVTAPLDTSTANATGAIALGRPQASARIDAFAAWMVNESIVATPDPAAPSPNDYTFDITQPRSQAGSLGAATEEFVYRNSGNGRTQQFSFNTPYGAPAGAACGRVAYSGFHVSAGGGTAPYATEVFPNHCTGNLTNQEKVLLYMLFDLGACVGAPPVPPPCEPLECDASRCGYSPDGCGNVIDCGPCRPPA